MLYLNSLVGLTENDEFAELKIPDNDAVSGKFELTISGLPTDAGLVTLSKIKKGYLLQKEI